MNNFTLVFTTRQREQEPKELIPIPRPKRIGKIITYGNAHRYEPSEAYQEFISKVKR